MRAINVLLSILVSLLLAVLVFEGGLRLIGFAPEGKILQFDPQLGWSKRPDAKLTRSTSEFDIEIETNALGLRDDPMSSPAKPAGVYRVVCLGDSFTLGFTVDREDLFVDQLEGWWNSEGRAVDVVNAGTEAYSTDQEVLWLMENGAAFEPDLVLLFPYENDLYWASQERYFRSPKPRFSADGTLEPRELVDPGSPGLLERTALKKFYDRYFPSIDPDVLFTPEGGTRPLLKELAVLLNVPPGFVTDSVKRTEGALLALKKTCDTLGAKLVVAPIPSQSAVDPAKAASFGQNQLGGLPPQAWSANLPFDTYKVLCNKLRIPVVDCREDFRQRIQDGEALYYEKDWHLDPAGNRAFATFLHTALEDPALDLFPAAHAKKTDGAIPTSAPAEEGARWPYVFAILWVLLTALYYGTYRDEPLWQPPLKVAGMLAAVFAIVLGGEWALGQLPPRASQGLLILFVLGLLGFILYKLGNRIATILELFVSFTRRGHWYLMPLVVVLLTIGSLLVVAASSPLIAPFIYTLF